MDSSSLALIIAIGDHGEDAWTREFFAY